MNGRQDRNLRFDLEYDGTDFAGWARQPGRLTIEGTLGAVLEQILQERVRLTVAGRTDAGVHARGQVVSFYTGSRLELRRLMWSANQMLPDAIAITGIREVAADFNARRSARARTYSYSILLRSWPSAFRHRFVNYINGTLDTDLLDSAAEMIRGHHDFTAFTPTITEHSYFERDIEISEWNSEGDLLVYTIRAKGFLRGMVRALVGTMLEVAGGRRSLYDLAELLTGQQRSDAGETAPPQGLCLEEIIYQPESDLGQATDKK